MNLPIDCVDLQNGYFLHSDGKVRPLDKVLEQHYVVEETPVYTIARGFAGMSPGYCSSFQECVNAYDFISSYGEGSELHRAYTSQVLARCNQLVGPNIIVTWGVTT